MAEPTKPTLLEKFQTEFPSLDSSLIAAFLSERDSETLTKRQLRKLRRTLAKLAAGADLDEQLINEPLPGDHIDGSSRSSEAIDRNQDSSSARSTVTDATSPLGSPCSTSSSTTSFSFALGLLQTAFPEAPRTRVERVITNASDGSDGIDMERAIQLLIAQEYPRNLGEDGGTFPALDNDLPATRTEGRIVNAKGKKKKHKLKIVTITGNDMRQQRLTYESASEFSRGSYSITPPTFSDVDIWTFVSSISAQLAELLPPHPESFFKSFFHAPEARTPATAIRRALTVITSAHNNDLPPLDMTVLLNLQDILRSSPEFNKLSAEVQKQFLSDAHLCLHAVGSRADDGLDLVWLLHSLDAEIAAGWKIAPCHQDPPPHQDNHSMQGSENSSTLTSPTQQELQPGRPPGRPPSQPREGWSLVSSRKRRTIANGPELSILSSNDLNATSTHPIGFARANDLARLKERLDDLETRHRELTMSAARARKGGNSRNLGAHVAVYYEEKARLLQEDTEGARLDLARARVNATKKITASKMTIDLHWTTTAQAITLAKECLRDYGASQACPVEFITGRGNHSAGGIAVLGPAVRNALIEDGWNVSSLPAGLVVYGRSPD